MTHWQNYETSPDASMQIDKTTLTSLITRLEEEYRKATGGEWHDATEFNYAPDEIVGRVVLRYGHGAPEDRTYQDYTFEASHDGPQVSHDATFIADAHNSMPTLLAALKHFMAVAEAGERLYEEIKDAVVETGYEFPALTAYRQALDTPSN